MLGEAAAPAGEPDEAVLVAAVDEASLAGPAGVVVDGWLDADAVALLEPAVLGVCEVGGDFFDDAGELVAEG